MLTLLVFLARPVAARDGQEAFAALTGGTRSPCASRRAHGTEVEALYTPSAQPPFGCTVAVARLQLPVSSLQHPALIGTPIRLETPITHRKQRVDTHSNRYTSRHGPTNLRSDFSARFWRDTGRQPLLITHQLPPSGAHSLTKPLNATYNESSSIQSEAACTL